MRSHHDAVDTRNHGLHLAVPMAVGSSHFTATVQAASKLERQVATRRHLYYQHLWAERLILQLFLHL